MQVLLTLVTILISLIVFAQTPQTKETIDTFTSAVDFDRSLERRVFDTASFVKEDGGESWDSLYSHKEYFYRNGILVKIIGWTKYVTRRSDFRAYYYNGIPMKFAKGEASEGSEEYAKLNFDIYYSRDKAIATVWLTPKPEYVLGVATDIYIKWAYSLYSEAK